MRVYRRLSNPELPAESRPLARRLIGCVLISDTDCGRTAGRIVETEAYLSDDAACHAFSGRSARNATLFGPPHRAYVYQIYGRSFCFNLSSEEEGTGAGVLVRALEPLEGIDLMRERRGERELRDLCRGPGRLCSALAIDRSCDGLDPLLDRRLWLAAPVGAVGRIRTSRRIGIRLAAGRLLRYYETGNRYVSGPMHLSPA